MIDLGNELRYQFGTKAVEEGQKRNAQGKYDIGLLGSLLGVTQGDMARTGAAVAYNSDAGLELQQRAADVNKPLTKQDFLNPQTIIDARSRISKAEKEKDIGDFYKTPQGKQFTEMLKGLEANRINQTAQITAQTKLANRQQDFLERFESMKLADKQDDRAQDLRILQMQQDADQARYNQNLELYREDQKQNQVNNLVAGLVALGAAFAV